MARPCPLPSRLVNTIVSAAKLAENLVARRWKLFRTVLEKHLELSAARNTWRASLSGDSLALFGSWDFPLFQRLMDEAGYEDKHLLHGFPAFLSSVLRLFLAYCHPNLCTQPFLCPKLVKESLT